jgi:hypothetical protein
MLSFFAVLMSWRLTGVWLHEWIGIALIAMIVFHLLLHWGWVESRIAILRQSPRRRFGALLLNTGVFAAMGATLVSGLVVSKIVVPNHLTPASYLHWHGLHESAATFTVILLGLHLAFNWDRVVAGIRRISGPRTARSGLDLSLHLVLRRLGWILVACSVLTVLVWAAVRVTPHDDKVMFIHADGTRELAPPPAAITKLRSDTIRPAPALGAPRFLVSLVLLLVVAVVGRRLLTLGRRRRKRARATYALIAAPAPEDPH